MANIVKFPESNITFTGEGCLDLPAFKGADTAGNPVVVSCWELSPEERAMVAATGRIYLHLWATNPQPSYVSGVSPFTVQSVNN